ncbi:MAG: putative transcriptional regulator [Ilumatobacter sp.]|jgi:putative transcriptional regulator
MNMHGCPLSGALTRISSTNWQTGVVYGITPATKGRLLVATPPLDDPNFDRAVIYILEHEDDGAVGVVINRPSDEALDEPLDRWIDLQTVPSSIFDGGPVEDSALIALAHTKRSNGDDENLTSIVGNIASADLTADPAIVAAAVDQVRVFRGYAGWGPGQLEGEIDAGAWLVLDAETGDVFSSEPNELWRNVLRRQPGRLAWLANAPDDLSLN